LLDETLLHVYTLVGKNFASETLLHPVLASEPEELVHQAQALSASHEFSSEKDSQEASFLPQEDWMLCFYL